MRAKLQTALWTVGLVAAVSTLPRALHAVTLLSELRYVPDITVELGSAQVTVPGGTLASEAAGTVVPLPLSPFPAGAHINAYTEDAGDPLVAFDATVDLSAFATSPPLVVESRDVVRLHGMKYSLELSGAANGIPTGVKIDAITRIRDDYLALSFDTTVTLSGVTFADDDLVGFDGSARSYEFKGADSGIAPGLNLDAAFFLNDNGHLLLSFDGSGSVGSITFGAEDVLEYDPLAHSWALAYDGAAAPHNWPAGANLITVWALAATLTPTVTLTPTPTATPTPSPSFTNTPSSTPTLTPIPTGAPTDTPTVLPTSIATSTPTQTSTLTSTATDTPTPSPTSTPTSTATPTLTHTATPSSTVTPASTATATDTGTATPTHTATQTPAVTVAATSTPSHTPTPTTATGTPSATPTPPDTSTPTASATSTASAPLTPTPTGTVKAACAGDCNGDGFVTVDELIKMVNIALGTLDISACEAGDINGDGTITVNEIISAVNRALLGC